MVTKTTIRIIEALGYVGAVMVGLGSVTQEQTIKYLYAVGFVFCIVSIVRLLSIGIALQTERLSETGSDVPQSPRPTELREEETR